MSENSVPNRKAGGYARAKNMSAKERKEMARRAAAARWGVPQAKYEGILNLGGLQNIPCWVLDDERRIISQRSFMEVLDMNQGSVIPIGHRVSQILDPKNLRSASVDQLIKTVENPIRFLNTEQVMTNGYNGEVIVDFCRAILYARRAGNLAGASLDYADQAERLLVSVAKTGIAALIDEATGYQEVRARDALAKILEQYIAKEWQPWTKTFPEEFYKQIYRLRKWNWDKLTFRRPQVFGNWTDDFVYLRLAPGVRDELRRVNPKVESGRRKQKHHQWLTGDIGHPQLRSHLDGVTRLLRASGTWGEFKNFLDKFYPRVEKVPLGFDVTVQRKPECADGFRIETRPTSKSTGPDETSDPTWLPL